MSLRVRTLPAGFIAPCLPTSAPRPPSGDGWLHEIKHDGFRCIARKDGKRVKLYSRPGNDLTRRFPLIVEALARLGRQPSAGPKNGALRGSANDRYWPMATDPGCPPSRRVSEGNRTFLGPSPIRQVFNPKNRARPRSNPGQLAEQSPPLPEGVLSFRICQTRRGPGSATARIHGAARRRGCRVASSPRVRSRESGCGGSAC